MKNIRVLVLAFVCVVSSAAPTADTFSKKGLLSKTNYKNAQDLGVFTVVPGAVGVGGLVGTGFVFKKIVRVAKEAIALKKQLHANPKDMSLRKKRQALIRKAIGLGIGGLVLGLLSVSAVGISGFTGYVMGKQYMSDREQSLARQKA
jgi:hypothetical protein